MPHFGAKIEEVSFRSLLIPTVGKAINLHHHWRSSFPSKYLILAPKTSGYLSTRSHPRVSFWRQNRRSVFPLAPYTYHGTGNLTVKFPFEVSYFGGKVERISLRPFPSTCLSLAPKSERCLSARSLHLPLERQLICTTIDGRVSLRSIIILAPKSSGYLSARSHPHV